MKAKDVFGVAVRILGLGFLYQAVFQCQNTLYAFWPMFPLPNFRYLNFKSLLPNVFNIAWLVLITWWMIRGAPWLMRLAYPEDTTSGTAKESAPKPDSATGG